MKTETTPSKAALSIARPALQLLVVINWAYGAGILAILTVSVLNPAWLMAAFKMAPSPEAERVLTGMRVIAALGLVTVPLHYLILKRLLAIVDTVRAGDAFVSENARRLQTIAWVLLTLNLMSIAIGLIGASVATKTYPLDFNAGFSLNGWLAVILTFVLARVFAAGSLMREDLEGTI